MASTAPCLFERRWPSVIQNPISINPSTGVITMTSTIGLHPKQTITLSLGADNIKVEVKRVQSSTSITVVPFERKKVITFDKFLLTINPFNGGSLTAPEQERNKIGSDVAIKNSYAEEPTVGLRVNQVDYWGCQYDKDNPFPVFIPDSSVSVTVPKSTTPFVLNVTIAVKNTEESFNVPANTKSISFQARKDGLIKYAFSVGDSETTYKTVDPGAEEVLGDLDLITPLTVYFQTTKDNDVLEVLYWT